MSNFLAQLLAIFARWTNFQPAPAPLPDPTPVPIPAPAPAPAPAPIDPVVVAINQARAGRGLSGLALDPALELLARGWAGSMAGGDTFDHGDFAARIASVYPNTAAGEDIAEGQPDAQGVVDAWMNSPPHRANILGDFNRVGAGSATSRGGNLYWCADFAAVG